MNNIAFAYSGSADLERAHNCMTRLVHIVSSKESVTRKQALPIIARRAYVAPGTLENITKKRIKGIPAYLRDRLEALLIRELQNEIQKLEAELHVARLAASAPNDLEITAAEKALNEAKEALGLK